jgi:flagellar protein FliS
MATFEAAKNKYVSDSVHTMSPGQLIVALYDRVLLDLERALSGLAEADLYAAHTALVHAQEIVHELLTSLDLKQWPGGASLAAVYRHVQDALVDANVQKDAAPILECKTMLLPLRDAWREAAGLVTAGGGS